jgi:hypothetical protein
MISVVGVSGKNSGNGVAAEQIRNSYLKSMTVRMLKIELDRARSLAHES